MKTELYKNCCLVRVPIKAGVEEYYLPQNVEWAAQDVDKIVICTPYRVCVDPIDGKTPVVDISLIQDMYVSLYDADNREIMHDVSFEQLLHRNNNVIEIHRKLNLKQCRLTFTTAPVADAILLLYVYYGGKSVEDYETPKKSVSVTFPLAANEELSLQDVINTYVHALPGKIKGIIAWDAFNNPAWLTLRDYKLSYQMANICTELCRPDMNNGTAYDSQAQLFLLDDIDIDFDYSHIREAAGQSSTQKITFLF